jgi:two-component system chemotaxis response regulator CheY
MAFNILIVDDSATIRSVIIRTLQIAEVPTKEIFQASDGNEALEVLKDNWVDLIFTDLNMPGMNGVEFIRQIYKKKIVEETPVVVISTEGSLTRVKELKELGIKAFIHKPFTPEQIKAVSEEVLGKWS